VWNNYLVIKFRTLAGIVEEIVLDEYGFWLHDIGVGLPNDRIRENKSSPGNTHCLICHLSQIKATL
jgi:hypothetical protein